MENIEDAKAVADALRAYEARIVEITSLITGKTALGDYEVKRCQHLLTELKHDLKEAKERGKVEDDCLPQTESERMYFAKAMLKAYVDLRMTTNSHPIRSKWMSCLSDARKDIDFEIWRIQQQFPGI